MNKKTKITLILVTGILCWAMFLCLIFVTPELFKNIVKSTEKVVFVENTTLESTPGIEILDANNEYFSVTENEENVFNVNIKYKPTVESKHSKCIVERLDYPILYVMAQYNEKQHPIIIDTGYDKYIKVNDVFITQNKLKIYPFDTDEVTSGGFSHIDEIQIGDMTFTNMPTSYNRGHYEKQVRGKTKEIESQFIMGLELLRELKYLSIDNINSKVEFSILDSFVPDSNETWHNYPMSIENDQKEQQRTMVEIPIEGKNTKIVFDTGAGATILFTEENWKEFSANLNIKGKKKANAKMTYGWQELEEVTVEEFNIGHKTIKNTFIQIFKNQSPMSPDFSLMGMGLFKDTAIVLDFEYNLFRVMEISQ